MGFFFLLWFPFYLLSCATGLKAMHLCCFVKLAVSHGGMAALAAEEFTQDKKQMHL